LVGKCSELCGLEGLSCAVVGDTFSDEEDVSHGLGVAETANTLGKVLSPILGTLFASLSWHVPFFTIPALSLLSLVMIALWIDDSKSKRSTVTIRSFFVLLKEVFEKEGKWLTAVFLCGIVIMTNLFGLLVYLSNILEDSHGIFGITKGLFLAIPLVTIALSSYLSGRFIGKEKEVMQWTTLIGFSLMTLACLAMTFLHDLVPLLGFMSMAGIGIGISLPSLDAIITESIETEQRGTITSVYSGMRYAGVAIGPPLFSLLLLTSTQSLFLVASGLSLMAAALVFFLIRP
jgi:ACDE family multidrug resistance protein